RLVLADKGDRETLVIVNELQQRGDVRPDVKRQMVPHRRIDEVRQPQVTRCAGEENQPERRGFALIEPFGDALYLSGEVASFSLGQRRGNLLDQAFECDP